MKNILLISLLFISGIAAAQVPFYELPIYPNTPSLNSSFVASLDTDGVQQTGQYTLAQLISVFGSGGAAVTYTAGTNMALSSTHTFSVVAAPTFSGLITANAGINVASGQFYNYNGTSIIFAQTASDNYYFGGSGNTGVSGTDNTGVGYTSLQSLASGADNTAIGTEALNNLTNGTGNTCVGNGSFEYNDGSFNTGVGYIAGQSIAEASTGADNTAIGAFSYSNSISSGSNNTAIGYTALDSNTTGTNNVAIGSLAGLIVKTGSNNIYIGSSTKASGTAVTNETVLGYNVTGNGSNTVTIGNSSNIGIYLNGNIAAPVLQNYTWSVIPVIPTAGEVIYITDAACSAPCIWGAIIIGGGGTTKCIALFNGTNWVCQ